MVGEWIWTRAAFGDEVDSDRAEYFQTYDRVFRAICQRAGCSIADIRRIRDQAAGSFIDFCLESIDWRRFGLIRFSVVFHPLLPRIGLARALKKQHPRVPILMGGGG